MIRNQITPRADWQARVHDAGLVWAGSETNPYWNESAYYSFTSEEIDRIGEASADLYRLFLRCGDAMLDYRDFYWLRQMGLPEWSFPALRDSWNAEPPALNIGRFDFGFDGKGDPKLFEFNCDTPGSLLETSVIQALWRDEVFPGAEQFNGIHQALVARWADLRASLFGKNLHITHVFDEDGDDTGTANYLAETARAAGLDPKMLIIDDIGVDRKGRFIDLEDLPLQVVLKFYAWEWVLKDDYGRKVVESMPETVWMEPLWKLLWSNKGILALAKVLEPENPYLLDAGFGPSSFKSYVKKPIFARQGANISITRPSIAEVRNGGGYGEEGFIYQEFYPLPEMAPNTFPVIGSWIVGGRAVGMGVREGGLITDRTSTFVPHIVEG